MTAENEELEDQESGSSLRQKLEEALAANKNLMDEAGVLRAEKVLSAGNFDLVEAADLKGVPLDKIEEKAKEIQEQRNTLAEGAMRKLLAKQGFDEDAIEDLISQAADSADAQSETAQAASRIRSVGQIPGRPVSPVNPEKLHGVEAIEAAFEGKPSKRRF